MESLFMVNRILLAVEKMNKEIIGDFQLGPGYAIGHSFFTSKLENMDIISQVIHHPHLITSNKPVSETKKQEIHRLSDVLRQVLEQKQEFTLLLVADEIRKLSELLNDGMITQEEFQKQKSKLFS
jgi:hypothetical protein